MKEGHIYIFGEVIPWQDDEPGKWGAVNLKDIVQQIQANKEAETLFIHIHSPGGDVMEGWAIYDALRTTGKKLITQNEGFTGSIATVIFGLGEEKKSLPNSKMAIHNPFGGVYGDADYIQKYGDKLKEIEAEIIAFYSTWTGQTEETIIGWMKEEKEFDADEALEFGFITEIIEPIKAVARINPKTFKPINFNKSTKMEKPVTVKELEKSESKIMNYIKELFTKAPPKSIILQDGSGVEIDFFERTEGDPEVGDKATVDGSPAEGSYTMPDGIVYVFVAGELTEINEPVGDPEEIKGLKEEKARLEAEVNTLTAKIKTLESAEANFKAKFEELKAEVTGLKSQVVSKGEPPKDQISRDGNQLEVRAPFKKKEE